VPWSCHDLDLCQHPGHTYVFCEHSRWRLKVLWCKVPILGHATLRCMFVYAHARVCCPYLHNHLDAAPWCAAQLAFRHSPKSKSHAGKRRQRAAQLTHDGSALTMQHQHPRARTPRAPLRHSAHARCNAMRCSNPVLHAMPCPNAWPVPWPVRTCNVQVAHRLK
jgi:hypothetical protein